MHHTTTASEIMTSTIHSVRPSDPVRKVVGLLCKHRISGVPVVDGKGRLAGLISERDVLEAMYPDRPELRQPAGERPGRGASAHGPRSRRPSN